MAAASPSEWLQQLSQPAVLSCQPANKSGLGILLCFEGHAVNSDERRGKEKKKKVSKWIRSSFMCHFHLVSFVAVTKLFLLIPSGSQARLWWKLQSFTWRIMGTASIEGSAGKGTVQSSMEHQWLQAAGYYLLLQRKWGREVGISLSTRCVYTSRWRNWPMLQMRNDI